MADLRRRAVSVLLLGMLHASIPRADVAPLHRERFIFTGDRGHVHLKTIKQRPDGRIVTVYYYNDATSTERYIGGTIWTP